VFFFSALISVVNLGGFANPSIFVTGVLRIFASLYRLSHVFRLRSLQRILTGLSSAALNIVPLCQVLVLFVCFFAILGKQMFARNSVNTLENHPDHPIANFATMGPNEWGYGAIVTVMNIIALEKNEVSPRQTSLAVEGPCG
jgi:hypothetical protein